MPTVTALSWEKGNNELLELMCGLPKKCKIRSKCLESLVCLLAAPGVTIYRALNSSIFCYLMWTIISQSSVHISLLLHTFLLYFIFIYVPLLSINLVLYLLGPAVSVFLAGWCSEWNTILQKHCVKHNRQVCVVHNPK